MHLSSHCSWSQKLDGKKCFLRENSKLHPHHPLVKNEPTSHCVHKSVLVRAYLHIWGELDVCIISAWVCCNYTVKVPMERRPPRLAPRHIPSFYCVLCPTEKLLHVSIYAGWWERWESRQRERTCVCKLRIKCVPLHALTNTMQSIIVAACAFKSRHQLVAAVCVCAHVCWLIKFSVEVWKFKKCLFSVLWCQCDKFRGKVEGSSEHSVEWGHLSNGCCNPQRSISTVFKQQVLLEKEVMLSVWKFPVINVDLFSLECVRKSAKYR